MTCIPRTACENEQALDSTAIEGSGIQQTLDLAPSPVQATPALGSCPAPKPTPAPDNGESVDDDDDDEFLDPIMKEVIVDPVVGSDGITYDR